MQCWDFFFRETVKTFQFWLISNKDNGRFGSRPLHISASKCSIHRPTDHPAPKQHISWIHLLNWRGKDKGHSMTCHSNYKGGSRGMAPPILYFDARWKRVINAALPPLYPGVRAPCPLQKRIGGVQDRCGRVWRTENTFFPTGVRTLGRSVRTESLYWLHYPVHLIERISVYSCRTGWGTVPQVVLPMKVL